MLVIYRTVGKPARYSLGTVCFLSVDRTARPCPLVDVISVNLVAAVRARKKKNVLFFEQMLGVKVASYLSDSPLVTWAIFIAFSILHVYANYRCGLISTDFGCFARPPARPDSWQILSF